MTPSIYKAVQVSAPTLQRVVYLISLILLGLGLLNNFSLAHHGTVVSRPNTPIKPISSQLSSDGSQSWLVQSYLEFSQWQSQSPQQSIYNQLNLGHLQMYLLDLRLNYSIQRNWNVALGLPLNYLLQSNQEQKEQTWGLGDMSFNIQYLSGKSSNGLPSFTQKPSISANQWSLTFGTIVPSGHYQREAVLTDSQLIANSNGGLELSSFSAQTSLGADTWQLILGTSLNWLLVENWQSDFSLNSNTPLSRTRDGIHWGSDINVINLYSYQIYPSLALLWGGQFTIHLPDQIDQNSPGDPAVVSVGGYQQLFLPVGIEFKTKDQIKCRLQAEVPLWQHINVPQLLKTYALSVTC